MLSQSQVHWTLENSERFLVSSERFRDNTLLLIGETSPRAGRLGALMNWDVALIPVSAVCLSVRVEGLLV